MSARNPYPRVFVTPEGRAVSIATMARALRAIRANPGADFKGWDWFPVSGHFILAEFHRGLDDRMAQRERLALGPQRPQH